jgi:hypothetical protein
MIGSPQSKGNRVEDDGTKAGDVREALHQLNMAISAAVKWGLVVEVSVDKAEGPKGTVAMVGASIRRNF